MRLVLLAVLAVACGDAATPLETRRTDNRDIDVGLMFEHDGCKVYRFRDNSVGYYHYFTKCPGAQVTIESSHGERVGKSSRLVTEEIPTLEEDE